MARAQYYLSRLENILVDDDVESGHAHADELICAALLSAASGQFSPLEARKIVAAYKRVPKWFA